MSKRLLCLVILLICAAAFWGCSQSSLTEDDLDENYAAMESNEDSQGENEDRQDILNSSIDWTEADDHVGDYVAVIGDVTSVKYGNPTFINIGNDYPNPSRFQAIIWDDDIDSFNYDLTSLEGETIYVIGTVKSYSYEDYSVPEIVVSDPADIVLFQY